MHLDLLEILRCPYCGGRLEPVATMFHRSEGDVLHDGVIACECCVFPVVDGIPVLHLQPAAKVAQSYIEAGDPQRALRAMIGADDDAVALEFEAAATSPESTYRDIVAALGPRFEGGYFLYRFSDPTFLVADAVVRAVASTVLRRGGRAIDVCGGSGHITRALVPLSSPAPVLADLFFPKIWLARRFTAPGAIPVCCDGNAPLPFARGSFDYAMCSDAFMFIWMKRQMVAEMARLVDGPRRGTVLINHAHNQHVWSPSHGQPLTPAGYRNLFDMRDVRILGESALFNDVVRDEHLDLTRLVPDAALDAEVALTMIASEDPAVFAVHPVAAPTRQGGEWRLNPLYDVTDTGPRITGVLRFPDADYEYEYGACREYLPATIDVDAAALRALQQGGAPGALADLIRRRVIVALPQRYC